MTVTFSAGMPFASIRSFINRSSAMIRSARRKLCTNMRDSRRPAGDFAFSHPAAIASSGLRSIDQKTKLRALRGTARVARKEIRGGDVMATTTSNLGNDHRRNAQLAMNVPKSDARRHLEFLPNEVDRTRTILIPFQVSSYGNRSLGSS